MSKITCFNNTKLEEAFNNNKAAEKFEENAAAKTIKAEYDSILAELNSIREELGLPLEDSKITVSELKFTTDSNDIRYQNSPQKNFEKRGITQEIIDKLKQNGLSEDVFLLSTEEINAKLIELGVSEDVRKQVVAYHGSPHSFDRFEFSDRTFLSGEKFAAFGAGLYFTDLENIARSYADILGSKSITFDGVDINGTDGWNEAKDAISVLAQDIDGYGFIRSIEAIKKLSNRALTEYLPYLASEKVNINDKEYAQERVDAANYLLKNIDNFKEQSGKNLYKVSLHKGKTPSEYTWLEWDTQTAKVIKEKFSNIIKSENLKGEIHNIKLSDKYDVESFDKGKTWKVGDTTKIGTEEEFVATFKDKKKAEKEAYNLNFVESNITGKDLYESLAKQIGQREASIFLLKNGIDGIKYPAESISSGATSDTARGFNYVVFDENAITIEEQIQFQKALNNAGINLITNGFTYKDKTGKDIVILNKDTADDSTSIHEFNHIFLNWAKTERPEIYKKGIDLIKKELKKEDKSKIKDIFDFVNVRQPELEGNVLLEEYLTEFVGRESKKMMDEQKAKSPLMQWLSDFWASIKDLMGITSMTPEQVANLNLRGFARASVVDLLKGERIRGEEAQEYFVRNADRLPLTLSVFSRPEFKDLQGKMVNPQTVTNYLNQSGIKQIEKDLIKQVIQDNFQGQKKISYDELEAVVRANIMPLERITTSSYADYGMDNLGSGNYGEAKTLILNAPIEHGVTGHFSGDFKASGRQNIKYQAKQLNDNVWVAVEEGYESQANDNNIYQYVGTAGTKEAVDAWIDNYENPERVFNKSNTKIVRDTMNGEETVILLDSKNSPMFTFKMEEFKNENDLHKQVLEKYNGLYSYPQIINKGMFGHIRVWQDGQDYYVAELQSDYYQKNNARKDILDKVTRNSDEFGKLQQTATIMGANFREEKSKLEEQNKKELLDFAKKQPNVEFKLQKTFNDDEKYNLRLFIDDEQIYTYKRYKFSENQNTEEAEKEIINSTNTVNEYLPQNVVDYKKELENKVLELENKFDKDKNDLNKKIEKIKEGIFNKLTPQEKQFIASQKEWEKRMVREAIKEASLSGATSLRFPTPYTLSVIEGYIKGGGLTSTTTGDIIEYLGEDYIILNGSEDDGVRIIPVRNMTKVLIEDFEQLKSEGEVGEDEDIYDYYIGDVGEGVESSDGQYFYYNRTYRPQGLETIEQGSIDSATKETFEITDLSETQQTVARKYEEIAKILETERGDNFETVTDENGFDWYETKIEASETQNPVIAFQIIGEKGASRVEEYNNLLNQAKELEKQGKDYSETGWFKNEQGQWKYFSNEILNEFLDFPQIKNKTVNLKDLLKKDSILLKAYPELENTKIEFYEDTKDSDFRGDERVNGTVTEEGETTILHIRTDGKGQSNQSQVLLHELNHKLQRVEQFARGGSPNFLLKIAGFITNSQGLSGREIVSRVRSINTDTLNKDDKKVINVAREYFNKFPNSEQLLEDGYFLLQGEVDSRAVELALELKNKLGKDTNFTYSQLVEELGKREGIDLVNEAISIFVDDVVLSRPKQTAVEPNATFNGFNSYSEAVKNTPINDTIKIDIAGVNVAEVTNNGDINDLIRQDIILDERELTPSGEVVFTTAGNSITKKLVNAEIAKEVIKGTINEDGNIVAKEKVELTKVSDDFNKNKKEFGESTALSILASQILLNNTPTLGNNRIIDYSIEIPSDNVLMTKLKNLLQELGIKIMSLEDWAKNYKTRTGEEPTANSLADISNRVIAFANGQVNQDTLSEEVMHFIVEALPQEQIQPLLDMIHKTDEWKQYAAQYTEIYKDDDTVRREILGKVLKNYIQSQQEQSTLQGQSVVRRLLEIVDKFIAQIRGLFKPQHQVQLDKFTEEIYQKLMKEELYSELSPSQFDGNTLVMYQAEPSTIYDYLTKTLEAFDSLDRKTGGQNKFELSLLDVENRDELNQLKATAALSAIIKTKIKYLTKRGRQSGFLSVEEQQVYDVALNELAPTLGKLKNIISEKPFSNAFLKQQVLENVTQTMTELSELSTALNEDNQKVFDTLVEDVAEQTGLTPEMTEILKNEIKTLQRDTNQFYSLYGSLSQAQSPILNILSTVISDAERESIIQYDRRQSEFINAAKALGFKEEEIADQLKKLKDGYYFISEYDFEAIEKEKAVFRAEAYSEVTGTSITAEEFLKEEQKLLKKLPQKQRNTYNFKFKEKVDKSGMHHDRLTKEERAKADSLIEGFSEKTKRFLEDQAKRKGAIAQRIKDNNGASKEDNNLLKELAQQRQKMANPYDEYGSLHKGLQVNIDGEISKSSAFDDFNTTDLDRENTTTILELAEYNKKIVAQYKAREAIEGKQVVPQSFIDKVQGIRGNGGFVAKATEFLLMNTRISYNSNFWEMFEKTNGLIDKLRESSDLGAQSTADDIQKNRTRLKNILKEHRDYNNPSQIDFENLGGAESTIKEISSDLEHLYEKAKSYLRDNETLKKTTESESITNKAYSDVIQDRGIDLITNRKDYEARLDFILKHVTPNSRARILRNADSFISYKKGYSKKLPKSIEKFENRSKGIVGFNEEVATYEDILDYAESLLLPYFKELKPTNFDMQEFVAKLVKAETEAEFNKVIEEAEYVTITPSYSLVDSEDNKRLNPKYTEAYEANDPTINLDYKGGILRSKNYIEMFAPDANGNATKNVKQKQLLDLTVGFWADSIESANMTDSFNKYQLPGIRRGSLARKEQIIKNFSVKTLKESIKDVITVREDDPIFGQAADTASRGALTIPRIGFSKLETAEEVTDELLYSLMHTANQAEKRKQRINSLDKIEAVKTRLRGASYGDKTGEATTAYKMADDFIRYNIYAQTETFKWETDFFGLTSKKYNLAPVIKHFQGWTRLVGLGFSTLVPLTSFLQGSTNFVVENIVGDRINTTASRLAARKAGQLVAKATKEEFMSDLKTKSELNLLMQFFGLSNPVSNFQNSNYGRTVRGLAPENSAYFSHFMGDLPLTAQTIMTVLYDFKVVDVKDDNGVIINTKLQSYSEWRNDNKALRIAGNTVPVTEKEAIAEWKLNDKYLYNYIETKKDGDGEIVGMQMNSEYYKLFAGKEKYANDRLNFVKRKITTVKQDIDNQIPNEDKSYIQRHAIFSFISMFKGFLITSVNKRFKDRHRSNQTNMLEEGTYKGTSAFLGALINSGRKGSFKDFWKEQYREFDGGYKLVKEGDEWNIYDTNKEGENKLFSTTDKAKAESAHAQLTVQATQMRQVSLKRAGLDLAVTASLATIALLLKGLADDDDDDYVKEFAAYMSYRVAVETTSQSTGIAGQLYSFIQSPTAGISQINNLINIGDLGSSEITKAGTYRGYSERDALLYRSLPLMKEYFRLKEIDRSRDDYKKYNKHFIDNFNMATLMFDEEARK